MKLTVLCLLLALTIVLSGCGDNPLPTSALVSDTERPADFLSAKKNPKSKTHGVIVGGKDFCNDALGGCDANFSLHAFQRKDGTVKGQWQDTFSGGGLGIPAKVNCLVVEGNVAKVGGVITKGRDIVNGEVIDLAGFPVLTAVIDNGQTPNDEPDQITFSIWGIPDSCADIPLDIVPFFDKPSGQVKVW